MRKINYLVGGGPFGESLLNYSFLDDVLLQFNKGINKEIPKLKSDFKSLNTTLSTSFDPAQSYKSETDKRFDLGNKKENTGSEKKG
jgi:hypothetical protein